MVNLIFSDTPIETYCCFLSPQESDLLLDLEASDYLPDGCEGALQLMAVDVPAPHGPVILLGDLFLRPKTWGKLWKTWGKNGVGGGENLDNWKNIGNNSENLGTHWDDLFRRLGTNRETWAETNGGNMGKLLGNI